jgi:hypothetical protein
MGRPIEKEMFDAFPYFSLFFQKELQIILLLIPSLKFLLGERQRNFRGSIESFESGF